MDSSLGEMCVDGFLKPENKHVEVKGLTHILHLLRNLQVKWIRYILIHVHNGKLWLEKPIFIMKKIIHKIMGLPMLNKAKSTKTLGQEELQKKTLAEWDDKGLKICNVSNIELRFQIHIIAHKIYISNRLNSVSCEAIDLAYKVVKKNLEFDLLNFLLK